LAPRLPQNPPLQGRRGSAFSLMSVPACQTCGAEAGPTHGERACEQAGGPLVRTETAHRCRREVREHRWLGHPTVLNGIERVGIFGHQWTVPRYQRGRSATLHSPTSLVVSQIGGLQ
jgi:hypothetical protein